MHRTITILLSSLLILTGVAACQPVTQLTPTSEEFKAQTTSCQETVNAMKALTDDFPLPDHLANAEPKRGDEFDPNAYFSVLRHLSLEPGTVLDFVYYNDGFGGWPILYTRQAGAAPYRSVEEYMAAEDAISRDELIDRYLADVQTDGTPDAFYELALLYLLGGQFYLYWHAGYHDASVICTADGLADLLDRPPWYEHDEAPLASRFPKAALYAIHEIDLEPQIRLEEDGVHVQFVTFSHWGGFYSTEYIIGQEYPHAILDRSSQNLVEYHSGINF